MLIVNSNYNGFDSFDIPFAISQSNTNLTGDVNSDSAIDVLDVVLLVNLVLNLEYDVLGDMNLDESLNILDVVQLVNFILS